MELEEIKKINEEFHYFNTVADKLEVKMGKVGMPLRVAVTGGAPSPGLDLTVFLVGKEACMRRIDKALEYIENRAE